MNQLTRLLSLALFSILCSCGGTKSSTTDSLANTAGNAALVKYDKVESLLQKMTLEEKIGQMNQYNGFWDLTGPAPDGGDAAKKYENLRKGLVGSMLNIKGVTDVRAIQKIAVEETRLGIPLIFGFDVIHGHKVQAPIPLAESCSWDLAAIKKSASIAAAEAAASGINWTFAPNVDISRDARYGRVMEGAGEDPYLGALIAKARVTGFQGDDLSDPLTVAACAKHFAAYGFAEAGRDYNTADLNRSTLHNVVLPPFKAAVDAGAASFMNAFNIVDGVPATANKYLQRDILKGKWGFEGFVVSDWGSIGEIVIHGNAATEKEAAMKAAIAGSDMDMESYFYISHLSDLVAEGKVKESVIDEAARRILNVKYELGLFDDPYKYCNEERQAEVVYADKHFEAVRDVARKSAVLLKNEGNLLPIQKGQKVAVIGPMVNEKNSPLGSWRLASDDNTAVSLKEGLSQHEDVFWAYADGVRLLEKDAAFVFEVKINETDDTGIAEAVEAARSADVVIMALGEHGFQSGEGRSRVHLDYPGLQQQLLEAVHAVNPNIVLVSFSGRPLDLSWADEQIPTILQAWQLGSESGNALADIIMGEYNPSGKLTMSFPRNVGQCPLYYNRMNTGRPAPLPNAELVFWSHYIDEEIDALYPFGHGLSYTDFGYSGLSATVAANGDVTASVTVKNTGAIAGEEVVQLYIHDKAASEVRPIQELKGFEKVSLQAGESKKVTLTLTDSELGYFLSDGSYIVEPGEYRIMMGGSSTEVLETTVNTAAPLSSK